MTGRRNIAVSLQKFTDRTGFILNCCMRMNRPVPTVNFILNPVVSIIDNFIDNFFYSIKRNICNKKFYQQLDEHLYESKTPIKTITGKYRHQHRSPSSAEAGTNEPPYRSSRKSNTFTLSPHTCRNVPTCQVHCVCLAALWKTLPTLLLPPFYVFSSVHTGFSTVRAVIPINPEVTKLPRRLASRASRGSAHGLTCRLWNISTLSHGVNQKSHFTQDLKICFCLYFLLTVSVTFVSHFDSAAAE